MDGDWGVDDDRSGLSKQIQIRHGREVSLLIWRRKHRCNTSHCCGGFSKLVCCRPPLEACGPLLCAGLCAISKTHDLWSYKSVSICTKRPPKCSKLYRLTHAYSGTGTGHSTVGCATIPATSRHARGSEGPNCRQPPAPPAAHFIGHALHLGINNNACGCQTFRISFLL